MMQNFFYNIPTKIAFGEGQITRLPELIKEFGEKVLLVYGGGSIKKIGLYDTVVSLCADNRIELFELSGVEPNPRVTTVRAGVELCRKHNISVILPVGGGSTIDCAKAIAAAYYYDGDAWELVLNNELITKAIPIISVLTLAATGSEMDSFAVISNMETNDKKGMQHPLLFPTYSVLDPTYTYSVPKYQTASGTADIMSHIFEVYFNNVKGAFVQERIMEGLLKTCFAYGVTACEEPDNYEARANLMWASSLAINGLISFGKEGPWPVHAMEHQLSAYYDVTHGHGLAVLTPVWMEHILSEDTVDMFVNYGTNVLGVDAGKDKFKIAKEAIAKTKQYFSDMGLTSTLRSMGIENRDNFEIMAEKSMREGIDGGLVPLTKEDVLNIYKKSF